ncbi:hypothetical protein DNTS_027987 [Danionella cerebrum]|uniref:Actin interacting protein 3-like C-terminal domain-containing protein n=1 Tax=Danionella cerebrum TaxID=2873325 RepID=A0A553RBV2_9TELE|nr:hypothetical protein DNTS_027987 [Danionella translucida]
MASLRKTLEPAKSNQKLCSQEDVDNNHSRKQSSAEESESDPWSPCSVPRRHTVGGPRTAMDMIVMQSYQKDQKKEAFLEHLKQKYPHHASVIMGHQERLKDQGANLATCMLQQVSVQTIRSSGHTHSVVGEPGEQPSLASLESLEVMSEGEALSAFIRGCRSRASLPVVKTTNQTKDRSLGFLYLQYGEETKQIRMPNEVSSVDTIRALFVSAFPQQLTLKILENVTPNSCLKVYHKDPAQAFNHNTRGNNGEIRITRERLYGSRQQPGGQSPVHTLPHSPIHHSLHGSMSPPTPRSMPSSPSRIPFGHSAAIPGCATLPRDRLSSVPPSRAITPCSSAILERRDVKPDEDLSSKSISLYAEGYSSPEARLSIASSQGSHTGDVADGAPYIQHRSSVKYTDNQDLQHPLYRQRSRKYSETQLPSMGLKTPPASPHRVNEARMIDMLPGQNSHEPGQIVAAERGSPVRRSFRKDSNGTMEKATRMRGNVVSPVFADLPPGHGERSFQGHVVAGDQQSERIKVMEQQIASLTGLVQHALMKAPNTSRENAVNLGHPTHNGGVCVIASSKDPGEERECSPLHLQPPIRDAALCSVLSTFRKNVSELRLQLQQLKQMQLQNQECVRLMLLQVDEEISERLSDSTPRCEDPSHRQRVQVEEERQRYLSMEEKLLLQLGFWRTFGVVNPADVNLFMPSLGGGVCEFPVLQLKMRGVLRVEVEAVRFLKDEPHKMDSMLKRVKALTDILSGLRRNVSESHNHVEERRSPKPVHNSPTPQPRSPVKIICAKPGSSSPKIAHMVGNTSTHQVSAPLTPTHNQDTPTVAKVSPRSREHSPALQNRVAPQGEEAGCSNATMQADEISSSSRPKTTEVSKEPVMGPETEQEMDRILQQTQASLMMAIPDLDVLSQVDSTRSRIPLDMDSTLLVPQFTEVAPQAGPMADKPVQASSEKPQKVTIEKPHRASTERAKLNHETLSKSPPPPPPRRFYPAGVGLTTGRSGEVIYTSRKESTGAQEGEEEAPQQKSVWMAPEVKPKPHNPPPVNTSSSQEEEDDGDKMMAGLQVFQKCTIKKDLKSRYIFDLTTHEHSGSDMESGFSLSVHTKVMCYFTGASKTTSVKILPNESKDATVSSSKVAPEIRCDLLQQQKWLMSDDLTVISYPSSQEVQTKHNDFSLQSGNFLKDGGEAFKTETPPISEVSSTEEKLPCNPSLHANSHKHGQHPSQVQETHARLNHHCDESHLRASDALYSTQIKEHEIRKEATRQTRDQIAWTEDASLSPDLPGDEGPPPPNNIAFRITKTKVQALSTGEYQQLVSSKGSEFQTVKVGSESSASTPEDSGIDRKPVIIIFDEPMDICQAYKRLSTIFECEEEMERVLSEEKIDEENEEEVEITEVDQRTPTNNVQDQWRTENRVNNQRGGSVRVPPEHQDSFESPVLDLEEGDKMGSSKDAKKKFKFKFPKKQLAAIGQALRTGTKTGKKTLQVVVYEDEEEQDGTVAELKEAKRFEIDTNSPRSPSETTETQKAKERTEELRKTTYKTLDSLEQTIRQLESTISDISPTLVSEVSRKDSKSKRITSHAELDDGSPTKRATHLKTKPRKSSLQRRSKIESRSSSNTSTSSSSSCNNRQNSTDSSRKSPPKSRQQLGNVEKPGKQQKLQDSQAQFPQVVLL